MIIDGKIDETGDALGTIPDDIIKVVQDTAEQDGRADNGILVTAKVNLEDMSDSLAITLPIGVLEALIEVGVIELKIESIVADIALDLATMKRILAAGGPEILLRVDIFGRSEGSQAANRPAFELSIQSGGEVIPLMSWGTISVSLPYTLAEGENPDNLVGVYEDHAGKALFLAYSGCNTYDDRLCFSTNCS